MASRARLIAVISLIVLSGCKPRPAPHCSPSLEALAEVRDGVGALEVALRRPPPGGAQERLDVCDPAGRVLGMIETAASPRAVTLLNPAGDVRGRLAAGEEDPTFTIAGDVMRRDSGPPPGPLRLHDERDLVRLLDAQGVPLAQLGREKERAIAFDGAGMPRATCETVEQRRVVRARDGAVLHYVIGIRDERAAAAIAIEALPLPERLALARFLDK